MICRKLAELPHTAVSARSHAFLQFIWHGNRHSRCLQGIFARAMAPICVHRAPRTPPDIATRHIGSRDDLPESVTSIGRYAFDNCPTIIYVPLGSEKIIRTDGGTTRRVSSAMTIPQRSNGVRENARWQQYIKNCCHLAIIGCQRASSDAYTLKGKLVFGGRQAFP